MFPIGEGPRVITFSMDFLELEESPFNNSQRLAIRSYYTANFGTQLDQLDFRDIRQADLYEKGKPYRLDYILNASLEPITYSRIDGTGSWTLESGKAHIWVYDPKKGTGTEPVTSLPANDLSLNAAEPFVGFTFTTFTDTSALMQIDNFTVYDGALVSTGEVVVEGGFAAWQAEHFDAEELADLEISGPEANPAGDGIPNLLKYALGLDPHVSSRDALPVSEIAEGELILVYTRPAGIEDVTYTVEVSDDLVNWVSGEEHVEVTVVGNTEDQTETVTVRAIGYPGANEKGFLRLKVDSQ